MTIYCLRIRIYATQSEQTLQFDSATERALMMISLTPYADVLESFEAIGEPAPTSAVPLG